jgi:hypothetical protein
MPTSPNSTREAMAYLRGQRSSGAKWSQLCLALTRTARDIPPRYPSALAAQLATPAEDRIRDQKNWRRGMVAFFDNASDGNPYGHIATLATRDRNGIWLTWSNIVGGAVRLVPITLFTHGWGDPAQFAAVSLNGYDLKGFETQTSVKSKATREGALANAVRTLRTEAEIQDKREHPARAKALRKDIEILRERHPEVFEDD